MISKERGLAGLGESNEAAQGQTGDAREVWPILRLGRPVARSRIHVPRNEHHHRLLAV